MYNRIIGLIGPTGSGKSHMAAKLMQESERCAVYQIKERDENFLAVADDVHEDPRSFAVAICEPQFRYIYRVKPGTSFEDKNRLKFPDFEWFVRACFARKDMRMVIDEAHLLCDARYMPIFLREAVILGRMNYLDCVWVSWRYATVSRELTTSTHEYYIWRIQEPGDLDAIAERCGVECAGACAELRPTNDTRRTGGENVIPGEYVHWSEGTWVIVDPAREASETSDKQTSLALSAEKDSEGSTHLENTPEPSTQE